MIAKRQKVGDCETWKLVVELASESMLVSTLTTTRNDD